MQLTLRLAAEERLECPRGVGRVVVSDPQLARPRTWQTVSTVGICDRRLAEA